jgi:hypothetical protein
MSNVPRAVQEAEDRANRLQEELINGKQQQATEQPANGDPKPTDETPAASTPPNANDGSQSQTPAQGEDWEHRFKVLQGKYNSEVPRFAEQVKELTKRLDGLEQENQQLKAKPPEPLVSQQEVDEYGEGLIDVARRIAREELAAKDAEINALKRQMQDIGEATTKTVSNDFFRSLTAIIPDWEALNVDPNFIKWLEEVDELTGQTKQVLLSQAEQSRDASRVAKFFTSYKRTASSWAANANQSLESQVVPATNKAADTPPSKRMWTRAEISEFYNRMRKGEVSDADAIAIEADITAASIEGRVR